MYANVTALFQIKWFFIMIEWSAHVHVFVGKVVFYIILHQIR